MKTFFLLCLSTKGSRIPFTRRYESTQGFAAAAVVCVDDGNKVVVVYIQLSPTFSQT